MNCAQVEKANRSNEVFSGYELHHGEMKPDVMEVNSASKTTKFHSTIRIPGN